VETSAAWRLPARPSALEPRTCSDHLCVWFALKDGNTLLGHLVIGRRTSADAALPEVSAMVWRLKAEIEAALLRFVTRTGNA
jgi:hypothetical protein